MAKLYNTKKIIGHTVYGGKKDKRIGKVRTVVMHPSERRVVGFLVRRPDAALMFHRKDLFAPLEGIVMEDGELKLLDTADTSGKSLRREQGVSLDDCVLWIGMPLLTKSGEFLGYVDTVSFDVESGAIKEVVTENGAANDVILGKRTIPGNLILGFKVGQGIELVSVDSDNVESDQEETDPAHLGAILVSDEALEIDTAGGVAATAGAATAVAGAKAKEGVAKAKAAAKKASPKVKKAAAKAEEAVDAGAFALGKQIGRTKGMFSAFKEEYKKAVSDDTKSD